MYPIPTTRRVCLTLTLIVVMTGSMLARAAVPQSIGYQAQLADNLGVPIEGVTNITFAIYAVDTGGIALWTDTLAVPVVEGRVSVELGRVGNPFPAGLFDGPLFLGMGWTQTPR